MNTKKQIYKNVFNIDQLICSQVDESGQPRWVHLCREVRLLATGVLDMWWWGSSNARGLGNTEYLFIVIVPGVVAPDRVLSLTQKVVFDI